MAPALPRDLPPAHLALLRDILGRLEGGVRFGPHWRARERRYPTDDSPICLVIEVAAGSSWRPVAVVSPAGIDAALLGGHAADYFATATHSHGAVAMETFTTATRPAPSVDAPAFIRVKDAGAPMQVQACQQQSGGTWEWTIVSLASQ